MTWCSIWILSCFRTLLEHLYTLGSYLRLPQATATTAATVHVCCSMNLMIPPPPKKTPKTHKRWFLQPPVPVYDISTVQYVCMYCTVEDTQIILYHIFLTVNRIWFKLYCYRGQNTMKSRVKFSVKKYFCTNHNSVEWYCKRSVDIVPKFTLFEL